MHLENMEQPLVDQTRVNQNLIEMTIAEMTIAEMIQHNQNIHNQNMENQNMNYMNQNMNYMNQNIQNRNTVYPVELRWLYQVTHIVPSEENFLYQINNVPHMYLVLYWLNLERLYPHFVEEEMDLESIALMEEPDFHYFQVQNSELFIQFVNWLRDHRIG